MCVLKNSTPLLGNLTEVKEPRDRFSFANALTELACASLQDGRMHSKGILNGSISGRVLEC